MVVRWMESNKAYELYKQTKNEEYIKIISYNAHGIARKYINEGRKKGCVYFMDEEDIDYAINLGISYALKTFDHSKSKFSTHLFRCVTCRIVNINKVLTTKNKREKDVDILSANYEIQEKDGKPQEIIDLIAYDKCLVEYNQETNYEIKDLINNLTDKNKKNLQLSIPLVYLPLFYYQNFANMKYLLLACIKFSSDFEFVEFDEEEM